MQEFIQKLKSKPYLLRLAPVLLVGMLLGYWLRPGGDGTVPDHMHVQAAVMDEGLGDTTQTDLFVCPMMCVPPQAKPGNCPVCGMELISTPKGEDSGLARVSLAPETVRLAQIRVVPVERKYVSAQVRLFGQIEYDPAHISYASVYVPGVIDRIYVKRAGQLIRWGDPLFDINSPEIQMIEEQMVDALKIVPGFYSLDDTKPHVRKRAEVLVGRRGGLTNATPEQKAALETIKAMRFKLTLIGMERKDIDELMKKGEPSGIATIYAQRSGVVIEQNAFEGTYVNTGTPVFAIANPRFIWARLKAYEADYPWIRMGQEAEFVTDTYPGETFTGKVAFIDPIFDIQSRTFDVGVLFPDSGGRFRPNMVARAVIHARLTADGRVAGSHAKPDKAPLVIPASAPLITGKRAVVYVGDPEKPGTYQGREITLGPRAKDYYVVLDGLEAGEQVVVNGNFKIDSQVQILGKSSMMGIQGGHRADAHHHTGGSVPPPANPNSQGAAPPAAPAMKMETTGPGVHRNHDAHRHQP
jgi:Cu(I)/Ag(I) efflux system membrane fusion protein